jgi:hypothetical protein
MSLLTEVIDFPSELNIEISLPNTNTTLPSEVMDKLLKEFGALCLNRFIQLMSAESSA